MSDIGKSQDLSPWFLYLLDCDGRALYTGISTDPIQRLQLHQSGKGAKFTRAFQHIQLCYQVPIGDRRQALSLECRIKRLTRRKKLHIIQCQFSTSELLQWLDSK